MDQNKYIEAAQMIVDAMKRASELSFDDEEGQGTDPCQKTNITKKKYKVLCNDEIYDVYGEGVYYHDDGRLQIFSNAQKGHCAAMFKEWTAIFIEEI